MKSDLDKVWKEFKDKVEDLFALGFSLPLCLHVSAIHKVGDKLQAWQKEIDADGPIEPLRQRTQVKQTKNSKASALSNAPNNDSITEESTPVTPKRGRGRPRKTDVKKTPLVLEVASTKRRANGKVDAEIPSEADNNLSKYQINTELESVVLKEERTDRSDIKSQTDADEINEIEFDDINTSPLGKTAILKSIQRDAINALLTVEEETVKSPAREKSKTRRIDAGEPLCDSEHGDPDVVKVELPGVDPSPSARRKRKANNVEVSDDFSQEDSVSDEPEVEDDKDGLVQELDIKKKKRPVGRPRKEVNSTDTVPPIKNHFCDRCSKGFASAAACKKHMYIHENGPLVCSHCDKKFYSHAGYSSHKKLHNNTAYQCPECPYLTGGKAWLEKHIILVHRKDDPGSRCHLCHQCGASFVTSHALKRHVMSHVRAKDYACPDCDHKTHNPDLLAVHRKNVHSNKDPYICNICGASCKYRGSLLEHQRRHLSDKPYQCTDCDYRCVSSTVLAKHRKKHMLPTYKCETCGKFYQTREHLKRHMVIHTGEKLYHCSCCSYKCNVPSNLHKHMKNLHNIHHISQKRKVERLEEISLQQSVIIEQETLDLGPEEGMTVVQEVIDVVPEDALPHVQHEIYLDSQAEDKKAAEIVEYVMQDYSHVGSDGTTHYVQQVDAATMDNQDVGSTQTITIVPDYTPWS